MLFIYIFFRPVLFVSIPHAIFSRCCFRCSRCVHCGCASFYFQSTSILCVSLSLFLVRQCLCHCLCGCLWEHMTSNSFIWCGWFIKKNTSSQFFIFIFNRQIVTIRSKFLYMRDESLQIRVDHQCVGFIRFFSSLSSQNTSLWWSIFFYLKSMMIVRCSAFESSNKLNNYIHANIYLIFEMKRNL